MNLADLILKLSVALIPEIPAAILAIRALFKKYPQLTAEQMHALVDAATNQADTAFDHVLAQIAADQPK